MQGSISLKAKLILNRETIKEELHIEVFDTGIGIKKENIKKLF